MKKLFLIYFFLFLHFSLIQAERRSMDTGWKFYLGDVPEARFPAYDDTPWRELRLPHDWAFENGYSADGAQGAQGGYASGGVGWYRKEIICQGKERQAEHVFLDFDAVYMNAEVWFNGHYLGKNPYGYIPFSYEVSSWIREGANVVAVRVDNSLEPSARWYHGCGIYGNVYLRTQGAEYFEKDGLFVSLANGKGEVQIRSDVKVPQSGTAFQVAAALVDGIGREVASERTKMMKADSVSQLVKMNLKVKRPELWSPDSPALYTLQMELRDAQGKVVDTQRQRIGFRDLSWDAQRGFSLNGKPYKLRGVCEHLEGGPVGAMYTPELLRWKLQLLKDMGCNAIRTAHNPQIPEFYDLCDEMGLLVLDEIFDGWKKKAEHDYGSQAFATHWERDLRTFIRRDRNHPCVILYSVGNETSGPVGEDLVRVCHEEDPTRLVTSGSSGTGGMDVIGMNGGSEAKKFLESYQPKQRAFIGTENPHTWQVRGYYRTRTWYRDGYHPQSGQMMEIPSLTEEEVFHYDWIHPQQRKNRKQIFNSSYDNATVRVTARHIIEQLRENDWFSGSFRWTGFDYLGEASYVHGGWPFRAFQSGALDLAGFPKDLYYLYQSEWSDRDMVHILPHWTHPMTLEGTVIPVWVYTNGEEVELFFNGKSLGRQIKGRKWNQIQCEFRVPWHPGTLEAVAYRDGKEIARTRQTTAGAPSRLGVQLEGETLKPDGRDIRILTLRQEDEHGNLYPYGENRIHVALEGEVRVLSFENGSPVDVERNFSAASRRCFFGQNRLFLQSTGGSATAPVSVILGAISGDKKLWLSDKVTINCEEVALRGELPQRSFHIHYTTDGSEPDRRSPRYTVPFSIEEGTTVKAAVYEGTRLLLKMKEKFGPEEGLYWGTTEKNEGSAVWQAEELQLQHCETRTDCEGHIYVVLQRNGSIAWYQENDGAAVETRLTLKGMSQSAESRLALYQNGSKVKDIVFPTRRNGECTVPVVLQPGANHFVLKAEENSTVPAGIDWMKWD